MTDIDNKLFGFFLDLKNIINYKEDNPNGLCDKVYQECSIHLKEKQYSDINMQNEKGNTLLHYAFYHQKYDYCLLLINHRANPYIQNHKQANAFSVATFGAINNFWKLFKTYHLDDQFLIKTQGYCPEFKQAVFEENIKNNLIFLSPKEIIDFLTSNKLLTANNLILTLSQSASLNLENKINTFITIERTPEDNSSFLASIYTFLKSKKDLNQGLPELLDYIYTSKFDINTDFFKAIALSDLSQNYLTEPFNEVTNSLLEHFINHEPNLEKPHQLNIITNTSWADFLKRNPPLNAGYLQLKLQKQLACSSLEKKKHKI
jgi:hypothetical protein